MGRLGFILADVRLCTFQWRAFKIRNKTITVHDRLVQRKRHLTSYRNFEHGATQAIHWAYRKMLRWKIRLCAHGGKWSPFSDFGGWLRKTTRSGRWSVNQTAKLSRQLLFSPSKALSDNISFMALEFHEFQCIKTKKLFEIGYFSAGIISGNLRLEQRLEQIYSNIYRLIDGLRLRKNRGCYCYRIWRYETLINASWACLHFFLQLFSILFTWIPINVKIMSPTKFTLAIKSSNGAFWCRVHLNVSSYLAWKRTWIACHILMRQRAVTYTAYSTLMWLFSHRIWVSEWSIFRRGLTLNEESRRLSIY